MSGLQLSIRGESTVQFQPLTVLPPHQGNEEWIVGHEASDTAIALPEPGVVAIQQLQAGATVAQARITVREQCGDDVDVADLVEGLADLGLVAGVDGWRIGVDDAIGQHWLAAIPPKAVAWLYSPPLLVVYLALATLGLVLLLLDAAIRPGAQVLLWSASYSVDTLALVLLSSLLLLKHELGHLLAGRGKGLSAELTIGRRLIYLVAVSKVAAVWKLPRHDRMVIYGAGMLNDLVFAGVGSLVIFAAQIHLLPLSAWATGLIGLLVISEYLGIAWQFQIFMKTDVYHVVADLTDRHDLPDQARRLVSQSLNRVCSVLHLRIAVPVNAAASDEPVDWLTVGYTLLAVIGIGGTLIWFVVYAIPASVLATTGELAQLATGLRDGSFWAVLDAAVALALQLFFLALFAWSWARDRRTKQRLSTQVAQVAFDGEE